MMAFGGREEVMECGGCSVRWCLVAVVKRKWKLNWADWTSDYGDSPTQPTSELSWVSYVGEVQAVK